MNLLDALGAVLDPPGLLTGAADLAPYLDDPITRARGEAVAVARPASTEAVAAVMAAAAAHGAHVTARGGGTGFVGGAVPGPGQPAIVLSLERMRRIRAVDAVGATMIAEAGVALAAAREAADAAGLQLPIVHGGAGSATIGGTVATNAGGLNVVKYGMARQHVLGLEVVLADGRIWHGLRALRKDNAGYDLKQLFIGTEGTLGIVTAAALALAPRPLARATALAAVASPEEALTLFGLLRRRLGDLVAACELIPRSALELHFARRPEARDPFATPHGYMVLLEVESPAEALDLEPLAEAALAQALEADIAVDVIVARSERERAELWALREGLAEAQATDPRVLKSDTAVPVAQTAAFVAEASRAVEALMPGAVPVPFGHIGDGNIHFNVLAPAAMATEDFLAHKARLAASIAEVSVALGGSIAAEHGIGRDKRDLLATVRGGVEHDLAAALKQALDPAGRLNPGKVV